MSTKLSSALLIFLLLAIVAVFLWPVLFGHKMYTNGDAVLYWYPLYGFYSRALHSGQGIPAWLPAIYSGHQGLINQLGFYNPLIRLIFSVTDFITAFNWLGFINLSLGAVFMFFFVSNFLKSRAIALFSALSYALSQSVGLNASSPAVSAAHVLLPLIFWCTYEIYRNHKWWIAPLVLAFAVGVVTAQPQFFAYTVMAGFAFAIFLDYVSQKEYLLKWPRNTGQFILALIAGIGIASPFLIKAYQLLRASFRAVGYDYAAASGGAVNLLFDPFRLIFPQFNTFFSSGAGLFFIGLPAAMLFFAVFFLPAKSVLVKFFIFLAGFSLISAVAYSPTFWLMHFLPFFNAFKEPARWTFVFVFSSIVLAGFSLEHLIRSGGSNFKKILFRISCVFMVIAVFLTLLFNVVVGWLGPKLVPLLAKFAQHLKYGGPGIDYAAYASSISRYLENYKHILSSGNPAVLVVLFSLVFCVLIFYYCRKDRISVRRCLSYVIGLTIIDFLVLWNLIYYPGNYADRNLLLNMPATVKFILAGEKKMPEEPFRTYHFYPGYSPYIKLRLLSDTGTNRFLLDREMVASDLNILYGINSIGGYENYTEDRMDEVLSYLGYEKAYKTGEYLAGRHTLEDKLRYFMEPQKIAIMSMMNTKYILSSFPLGRPLIKVYESRVADAPVYVYQNPEVLSRAYFAKNIICTMITSKKELFGKLLEIKNYAHDTLLEKDECKNISFRPAAAAVVIERHKPSEYILNTKTDKDGYLVLSESAAPGWHAFIDGKEARIYTANFIYQAIFVPAGSHSVEFSYVRE